MPLFDDYDMSNIYQNDEELVDLDISINQYMTNTDISYYDGVEINSDTIQTNIQTYPSTQIYDEILENRINYSDSLSKLNSNFVNDLDISHSKNLSTMSTYIDKQNILNKLKITNNTLNMKYEESILQPSYIFFISWCFLFIILIFTLLLNLVEDQMHINLITKFILFIVFLFIIIKSYKNIANYFNN